MGIQRVKLCLKLLFAGIFVFMVQMTIRTSIAESLWTAIPGLAASPWTVATLYDAYFGFLTFYVWVAYKEPGIVARIVWFVLIMALGNIAMSVYVLIQLFKLRADEPAENILWRRAV